MAAAAAVCLAAFLLALVWSLAAGGAGLDAELLWQLRRPRILAAMGVGALLAWSGLALQIVLRNPLADPYVLGTSGAASVGALLALMLGAPLWLGASAGGLLAGALLMLLARSALASPDDASSRLILLGAMLAAFTGAAGSLLLRLTSDAELRGALFWLIGDLSGADERGACLLLAVVLAVGLARYARAVDRLMLGSEAAYLLGEPVRLLRLALVAGACLAAAAAVAAAGSIGFVGLVVPHALRLVGVLGTRTQALVAPLGGAALVLAADTLARTVAAPLELPVGALLALLGAPVFVWFLLREQR